MTITARVVTDSAVTSAIASRMRIAGQKSGPDFESRVVAEYLRYALTAFCAAGATVHVHRLLGSVRNQLRDRFQVTKGRWWVDPDAMDQDEAFEGEPQDILLKTLKQLEFIGDCGHAGGGYYLPTPVRYIQFASGRVVLGGMPVAELDAFFGDKVGWAGLARGLFTEPVNMIAPALSTSDWAGLPSRPHAEWTDDAIAAAQTGLSASASSEMFEVYSPHAFPRRGQSNRWCPARNWSVPSSSSGTDLHLCRTLTRPRRFWLSPLKVVRGVGKFSKEFPVAQRDARRLMYGIDRRTGFPTTASFVQETQTSDVELRMFSWLPREEHRILLALGFEREANKETHIPSFRLPAEWWPEAERLVTALGIIVRPLLQPKTLDHGPRGPHG